MSESTSLSRDGRKIFYWTVESTDTGLGPVEIRVEGTPDWLATTVAAVAPVTGFPRYSKVVAGPDAAAYTGALVITRTTWFTARLADNPEIEIGHGRITLTT